MASCRRRATLMRIVAAGSSRAAGSCPTSTRCWVAPFSTLGRYRRVPAGPQDMEIFAAHWPNQPSDDPLARTFNRLPKYVVSTTLTEPLSWQNSILIGGDVVAEIAKVKDETGKD